MDRSWWGAHVSILQHDGVTVLSPFLRQDGTVNRTDRLHAINEALRRAGPTGVTALRLAEDLEVSVRTIKRDVTALQQTGAPIWGRPGPGGGYVLDGMASLPPVAFTPSQAVAVATALAVLPPASPFSPDVRAASGKVLDTLDPAARARASTLAGKVWVLRESPEGRPRVGVLRAIEQSLVAEVVLSIRYRSSSGAPSTREVEPIIAAWTQGRWYLVAHCRLRDGIRWFRLDRIERADATREHYAPRPIADVGTPPEAARPVG